MTDGSRLLFCTGTATAPGQLGVVVCPNLYIETQRREEIDCLRALVLGSYDINVMGEVGDSVSDCRILLTDPLAALDKAVQKVPASRLRWPKLIKPDVARARP